MISLLFLINLCLARADDSTVLEEIRLDKLEDKLVVHLDIDQPFSYKSFSLSDPNRVVIDFIGAKEFHCPPHTEVIHFGVKAIRVAKYQPDVTRVVFDLAGEFPDYKIEESTTGLTAFFWLEKEIMEKEREKVEEKPAPVKKEEIPEEEKETEVKPEQKPPKELFPRLKRKPPREDKMAFFVGLMGGFQFMHASRLQDVYGKSSPFTGVETFFKLPLNSRDRVGVSLGFRFISDKGENDYQQSRLEITPITLSVFYLRKYGIFSPFVGLGVDHYNYSENSPETIGQPLYSRKTWGGHIQAGTYIHLTSFFSLKFYIGYYSARFKESGTDINLGGNGYGVALAYYFRF